MRATVTRLRYLWRAVYWLILDGTPLLVGLYCCRDCGMISSRLLTISLSIIGFILIIYGIILNIVAGRLLRLYGHSGSVPRFTPPDRLVDRGVYSCMRHPAQLGLIMVGIGVGLASGTLPGIISIGIPIGGGALFILLVEEPEARELLGSKYHEYEERVPPFSLNPKCILRWR
jgi:protein-S-isoprenylcysteine O-methyltransferase Ste14